MEVVNGIAWALLWEKFVIAGDDVFIGLEYALVLTALLALIWIQAKSGIFSALLAGFISVVAGVHLVCFALVPLTAMGLFSVASVAIGGASAVALFAATGRGICWARIAFATSLGALAIPADPAVCFGITAAVALAQLIADEGRSLIPVRRQSVFS